MANLFRSLFVLLAAAASSTADASSRPSAIHHAVYDFYIGGLWTGELELSASLLDGHYEATAWFQTTGIVGFFKHKVMRAEASGRIVASGLQPIRYALKEREGEEEQTVEISFNSDGPTLVEAEPGFKARPWSIDPGDQADTIDPLSAILLALLPRPASRICDKRIEAFDGRRRFAFKFGPAKPNGAYLVCKGSYLRLAGFKPETLKRRPRDSFSIYLQPRGNGSFQLVRLVSDGTFGKVVMRLR